MLESLPTPLVFLLGAAIALLLHTLGRSLLKRSSGNKRPSPLTPPPLSDLPPHTTPPRDSSQFFTAPHSPTPAPHPSPNTISSATTPAPSSEPVGVLTLMEEKYQKHHQNSVNDLTTRQEAIDAMVQPINQGLRELRVCLTEMQTSYTQTHKELSNTYADMRHEFQNIFSKTAHMGSWGEIQLQKVMEYAGLTEQIDFELQPELITPTGTSRPDAIVNLPQGGCIIIDAKTPMEQYLIATGVEADRKSNDYQQAIKKHIKALRQHINLLSKKEYTGDLRRHSGGDVITPQFVVLFVPLEGLYGLALEHHINIFEEACEKGIIIATPSSLLALLKTTALILREHDMLNHGREISRIAQSLMESFSQHTDHLGKLGRQFGKTLECYNQAVKSFDEGLLPQARELQGHGAGQHHVLVPAGTLHKVPRPPQDYSLANSSEKMDSNTVTPISRSS